jgi:CRP-like cAMP-binding protein
MAEITRDQAAEAVDKLLLKLRARDVVSPDEEQVLAGCVAEIRHFAPGKMIVRARTTLDVSTLLIDGIVCRYKDLADGQRQILELHVGGDFLDLHGFLLKQLDHNVAAITAIRVAFVPHEALLRLTQTDAHLTRLMWFSTLLDSAIHREKILSVGRRDAEARVAHILCELYMRLRVVGLADEGGYALPLTQADLGDATGLTSVHVNRMLKRLREEGLLTFRNGRVDIQDWEGLQRAAEFDPTYLYLERRPR